jgi:hypothetical protein
MRAYTQVGAITSRTVTRACKGIRVLNGLPPMPLTATLGDPSDMHTHSLNAAYAYAYAHDRTTALPRTSAYVSICQNYSDVC